MEKNKKNLYFLIFLTIFMVYELIIAIITKWILGIYLGFSIIAVYSFFILYYIHKLKHEKYNKMS